MTPKNVQQKYQNCLYEGGDRVKRKLKNHFMMVLITAVCIAFFVNLSWADSNVIYHHKTPYDTDSRNLGLALKVKSGHPGYNHLRRYGNHGHNKHFRKHNYYRNSYRNNHNYYRQGYGHKHNELGFGLI